MTLLQRHTDLPAGRFCDRRDRPGRLGLSVVSRGGGATLTAGGVLEPGPRSLEGGGDEFLASAAESYLPGVTAVVLTGKPARRRPGVQAVKRRSRVLVEELATARAGGMPSRASRDTLSLPIERLASAGVALSYAPGGARLLAVDLPSWASLAS